MPRVRHHRRIVWRLVVTVLVMALLPGVGCNSGPPEAVDPAGRHRGDQAPTTQPPVDSPGVEPGAAESATPAPVPDTARPRSGISAPVVSDRPEGLWESDHNPLTAGLIADARAAQELGDSDRAIELAENAVDLDPGAVAAWDLLVEAHRSADQPAEAADACHRMLSSEQVALAGFEGAQREQRCAMLLIQAERLDDAERWARAAVEQSYGRLEPMVTLSAVLLDQERPGEVIQLLEGHIREGVGAGRVEVAALTNLGAAYALLGETQAAAETYRAALAIDPRDTGALINLADAYRQLGQPEQAAETLQQILEIDPDHAEARRRLGR